MYSAIHVDGIALYMSMAHSPLHRVKSVCLNNNILLSMIIRLSMGGYLQSFKLWM